MLNVKPGDKVYRFWGKAAESTFTLLVLDLRKGIIIATPVDMKPEAKKLLEPGELVLYEFDQETGAEVDTSLGWDGKTVSGSFITLDPENEKTPPKGIEFFSVEAILVQKLLKINDLEKEIKKDDKTNS